MNKRKFSILFTGLMAALLLTVNSCEKPLYHEIKIQLVNGSNSDVHMWIDGESIDASNKLAPGASRTIDTKIEKEDGKPNVTFKAYAGQNGQTLTSKSFETESILMIIRYNGGSLVLD